MSSSPSPFIKATNVKVKLYFAALIGEFKNNPMQQIIANYSNQCLAGVKVFSTSLLAEHCLKVSWLFFTPR